MVVQKPGMVSLFWGRPLSKLSTKGSDAMAELSNKPNKKMARLARIVRSRLPRTYIATACGIILAHRRGDCKKLMGNSGASHCLARWREDTSIPGACTSL